MWSRGTTFNRYNSIERKRNVWEKKKQKHLLDAKARVNRLLANSGGEKITGVRVLIPGIFILAIVRELACNESSIFPSLGARRCQCRNAISSETESSGRIRKAGAEIETASRVCREISGRDVFGQGNFNRNAQGISQVSHIAVTSPFARGLLSLSLSPRSSRIRLARRPSGLARGSYIRTDKL